MTEEIPMVVWEGAFVLFGVKVRCYVLDDGQRIMNADDTSRLFERMGDKDCPQLSASDVLAFGKWHAEGRLPKGN